MTVDKFIEKYYILSAAPNGISFEDFQKYLNSNEKKTPAQNTVNELHDAWWNVASQMGTSSAGDDNPCSNGCDWKIYDSGFRRFEYCSRCNSERSELATDTKKA
jgi:hypothetical protein